MKRNSHYLEKEKKKKSPKTKGQVSCRIPLQKDFFQGGFYWKKSLNWFFSGMLGGEFSSRTGEEWPRTVRCLHRVGRRTSGERVEILHWRS